MQVTAAEGGSCSPSDPAQVEGFASMQRNRPLQEDGFVFNSDIKDYIELSFRSKETNLSTARSYGAKL